MCGTVSFKKGDSFHRANKVIFKNYCLDRCEATVTGRENFHVTIEKDGNSGFRATCSCPKLASFQRDCQHIAAVLLSIYEHQRHGKKPIGACLSEDDCSTNQALTEGLLTLFNDQPIRSSGQQYHFEQRQIVSVEFTCKPVTISKGQSMFGIEMMIDQIPVKNIRDFLVEVQQGHLKLLSSAFKFDPKLHCFEKETDAVMQKLIQVMMDEKIYITDNHIPSVDLSNQEILLIPPSSWESLLPLLEGARFVKLEYDSNIYESLHVSNEALSLQFNLAEDRGKDYQLKVSGLKQLVVLTSYNSVLSNGRLIVVKSEDCKRISDLKQMLETSKTDQIPIREEQIHFFLDKVVPGLKKLGDVRICAAISCGVVKTPLIAKLYLDRLKNRLLAGLEFHYENFVMNPLENRELNETPMLVRDVDKEEAILQRMEDSGFAKTDGGYFLQNEELEYEFLYHDVPQLHSLVQIYATSAVKIRIFKGNTPPQIRIKAKKERTNWLEFKFEMDGIPETHIREVLAALEEKRKFYRLRNGSLLSLESKEFKDIQRFLTTSPVQKEELEKGLNVPFVRGLQLLDSVEGSPVFSLEASFHKFMESLRHPERLEFAIPKRLEVILRDYQKQGFQWLKKLASFGFGGILADDMGLGKTLQSITFIVSELPEIRQKRLPVFIVCPSSLTYNWMNELKKFAPDVQALVVDGNKAERIKKLKDTAGIDVVITSYPLLRKDIHQFEKQAFHTVFFDEAQAFKNPVTQTARAVKKIQAEHRFALTGTPVENSLVELWSIFHVVFPELFLGLKEYSNLTKEAVARRTHLFLLRRLKEDVLLELPEKIESTDTIELLPEQKKLYAAYLAKLRHETLKHLDKDTLRKNRIKILAGLTRLRQICCHPSLFVDGYQGNSAKFEQLMQMIEEAKLSGRRVLIFSQFTKMLELIGRKLANQGNSFFYLDGQTPSEERVEICNKFNRGERSLFLISLKAGGTGLNLTGADTVILYDLWWNPAVEEQAADRAHRIGQTNVVQVIKLVAKGTIEEKINELQEKKRHLIEEVIDPEKDKSPTFTEEDLHEILGSLIQS